MSNVLLVLLESSATVTLVLAGLSIIAAAVFIAALLYRSTISTVGRLVALVLEGQPHEARIRARRYGGNVRAVLDALGGGPVAPPQFAMLREIILAAVCLLPALALPIYGVAALDGPPRPETVPLTAALMVGFALLLPASLFGAVVIIHLGTRAVEYTRAACIKVLAQQIRAMDDRSSSAPSARGPQ